MSSAERRQVEQAFGAAIDYDRHAQVQWVVARRLAARIAALDLPSYPRILEIGCGSGFLTTALIELGVVGNWLITDLSPAMVERCRVRVGDAPDRRFAVMDGEYGTPGGRFDLICSSLAMQWFDEPTLAFARMGSWLEPGGHCMATTLTDGSFAEWRAAHKAEGVEPGILPFPSVAHFAPLAVDHLVDRYDTALDFLRALKSIGAKTAVRGHRPLPPPVLRRVMQRFEQSGCAVSYQVATCHYFRP